MMKRMNLLTRLPFLLIAGLLLLCTRPAHAAPKEYGTVTAVLNVTALQPGKEAIVAVVFDVKEGFHAQSRTPKDENAVKYVVKVDTNDALTIHDVVYQKGEDHNYEKLGLLNVYTGRVITYVPVTVKADAKLGEITLTGSVGYQACDDNACYFPTTTKFSIQTKLVAATDKVEANQPDLFKDYQKATQNQPTTMPAGKSSSLPPGPKSEGGWGSWFSKPWFVWPVTAILVLMALGMFGLFTFRLPLGVYTVDPRHDTYVGNFLFGILTAVLSTPCTAPLFPGLLAWAVLQAKSGGKFVGIGVITMVGIGMALPYLLLSLFPEAARRIPRTGAWSELVKQMMGFLILGVAAYFAGQQVLPGNQFMWAVFVVAVLAGIFLLVRTASLMPRARPIVIAAIIAIAISYGSFSLAHTLNKPALVAWQHYSDEALADARAQKKLVLVKFTAKWCANCQWIESTVFTDPRAVNALEEHHVLALKADLTKDGAPGADLVEQLNPGGGIPVTAIYSPKRDQPYTLKSIYTTPKLLDALDAAEKGAPWSDETKDMSYAVAFGIALLVGVIFNVMPCVLPVLPLKAIGFYETSRHNRARSFSFGLAFSAGIVATFAVLALLVLPISGKA
jgi:thiol:disulfide interchange protein